MHMERHKIKKRAKKISIQFCHLKLIHIIKKHLFHLSEATTKREKGVSKTLQMIHRGENNVSILHFTKRTHRCDVTEDVEMAVKISVTNF